MNDFQSRLNDLRKRALACPTSVSVWTDLADHILEADHSPSRKINDVPRVEKENQNLLESRTAPQNDKESQQQIAAQDDLTPKDLLDSARSLLERGLPSECIGICKYLESKTNNQPVMRAWSKYLHGAARMKLKEVNLAISLLEESIELHNISHAALTLADYYATELKHELALSYYTYAANWEPAIEGEARQQLEEKIKKASSDYQSSRLAVRQNQDRGSHGGKSYINDAFVSYDKTEDIYGPLQDNPLVSILIVSYNSNADLVECFESITRQTYQNWEVVVVDNSDKEDASTITHKSFGDRAIYIKQPNIGFAAGNNVAASKSKGDLFLLLNPDATLADNALKELVNSLRFDGSAGIVSPKIYFKKEFLKVQFLEVPTFVGIDLEFLSSEWQYKKVFVNKGLLDRKIVRSDENGEISIELPIDSEIKCLKFQFVSSDPHEASVSQEIKFRMQVGRRAKLERFTISKLPELILHKLSRTDYSSARSLINNAGSGIREDGTPYDRGFAQEDHGQFSQKEYIQAFCGCCALIRRNIFAYRKLFIDELFAYYEDSELSYWCDKNNIPILYCPGSRVFHRHSESTTENSPSWNCLVYRSKKIYDLIKDESIADIYEQLATDDRYPLLMAEISPALRDKLSNYDNLLKGQSRDRLIIREGKKSVAIYNAYMNTYGGGEKHILAIAQELSRHPEIEITLICERDFSLDDLLRYFRLTAFRTGRLMVGKMTPKLSAFFDCFINSTFLSQHISLANLSYYVVSFPGKEISDEIRSRYVFLHNSDYTSEWSHRYWGEHKSKMVYPVLGKTIPNSLSDNYSNANCPLSRKERLIISVGRFDYGGHCKNQHLIIKAFIKTINRSPELADWRLRIMGSVDFSREESRSHYDECLRLSDQFLNVEVLGNVDPDLIATSYNIASIYVHSAGLEADLAADPNKAEHFGIAVYDGLANGCACVVFAEGGPKHMVNGVNGSICFNDFEDMVRCMSSSMLAVGDSGLGTDVSLASCQRAEELLGISQLAIDSICREIVHT
jgi:GT2 family glycosyltransferase